jgi:ABC-type transporter Mla subunit MlaD
MEEMNASVLEIAQNASQTSTSSTTAKEVASKGGQEVGETLAITRDVVSTTERLATVMNDLAERAENIGQVLSVINDIADQTNLLALNAAIEAARAGEAGRGFAVVADEVRKLAEKTMSATKEVHEAVAQIQDGTQKAVGEMDATREQVSKAADMAEQAGQILENIIEQSDSIAEMVSGIAVASEEQSATSDEINSNVNTINQVSADLSERIQQANTEIHEVAAMASNLTELVAGFREQEEEEDTRQIARERRKHERFLLKVFGHEKPCTIQTSAGASYKASLIDVSRGGVRVKLADGAVPLEQGDKIRFFSSLRHDDFRLDDFSARIKWVIDNECGMEFDALLPVDVSTIQAMLME